MANTRQKGDLGEDIACKFLEHKGFTIVARNYYRKWGELDIVAEKDGVTHFCEVKSVYKDFSEVIDAHRPEENVDAFKVRQLRRIIETYRADKQKGSDEEFQFHVLCIYIDTLAGRSKIKWIRNLVL